MSKVYVIQNTHKLNRDTSTLEPKYDFSSAERFGQLVYLLTPNAKPHDPSVLKELKDKLREFGDNDHLLLVGNPALIGFACAIAADWNEGRISVLQWDGKVKAYAPIAVDLYAEPEWKQIWSS